MWLNQHPEFKHQKYWYILTTESCCHLLPNCCRPESMKFDFFWLWILFGFGLDVFVYVSERQDKEAERDSKSDVLILWRSAARHLLLLLLFPPTRLHHSLDKMSMHCKNTGSVRVAPSFTWIITWSLNSFLLSVIFKSSDFWRKEGNSTITWSSTRVV